MANANLSLVRAVGYIRMSTSDQADSPAQQRREIERYASQHGYSIIRWFEDQGISGDATEKRVGFQAMHKAACDRKRDFDCILVWDLDRFGRFNSIEAGYWIHPLVQAGVRLATVSDGPVDWLDFSGRLLNCVKQEGKHQFLVDMSRNVTRGLIAAAKSGKSFVAPFGYRRDSDTLAIEPNEAAIVRRMFDQYHGGKSLRGIAYGLNDDSLRTTKGSHWTASGVKAILTRRAYVGTFTFGERQTGKYHVAAAGEVAKRNGHKPAPEPIVIEDHHPAIVDAETFAAVQVKLSGNRRQTSPHSLASNPYLLSGLIRCGCCGSSMTGSRVNDSDVRQYTCLGYMHSGKSKCSRNVIKEQSLVDAILAKLRRDYLSPEKLDERRAEIDRQRELAVVVSPSVDTDALRRRLADAERKIEALTDKIVEAPQAIASTLYGRLEKLQGERDEIRQAIEAATRPTAEVQQFAAEQEAELEMWMKLQQRLANPDPADLRDLLRTVIDRIELQFKPGDNGKPAFSGGFVGPKNFQLVQQPKPCR